MAKGVSHMAPSILFVCLGNICRSPLAEAAFRQAAARAGLVATVDSAGTGDWHIGDAPDPRAQATALRHGIDISAYKGRQVGLDDFARFTHIIALDRSNLADLQAMQPDESYAKLSLMLDHVPGRAGKSVADPYYGDARDFDTTWRDVSAAAAGLVTLMRDQARV
jgi:protein-tyrosine phosphatase